MTKTKTCEMVMAAALMAVSACGSVIASGDDEPAPASGDDADVGSEGALTFEESAFVNDGLRLWTNTSGPQLGGKYEGGSQAVLQVKVGAAAPLLATLDGARWDVQLPSGSILTTDTLVTLTMTDPESGVLAREVTMALDSTPPVLAIGASKMRDERGDMITFASNVPVHDHQGTEVDLASGCPVVYKYSYLMDTHAPVYGSELAPNPITYAMTAQDVRVASTEFRVRDAQGGVLRDWKPVTGSGAAYPVTLYRDGAAGIGDLATRAGTYTIDVRATDWGGLEASTSYCVDFKPLAAPLDIAQASLAPASDTNALVGWQLYPINSPISRIAKPGVGAEIAEQLITQYSSEPIAISPTTSSLTGTWRISWVQGWVASEITSANVSCQSMDCQKPMPESASHSGALTSFDKTVEVVDGHGNALSRSQGAFVIPARAAGSPPATYRVRVSLANVTHYGHSSQYQYGDFTNGRLIYTGTASNNTTTACYRTDSFKQTCTAMATYQYLRGIDTIGLTLDPFALQLAAAATPGGTFITPAHVNATAFQVPALSWDGGNENWF